MVSGAELLVLLITFSPTGEWEGIKASLGDIKKVLLLVQGGLRTQGSPKRHPV